MLHPRAVYEFNQDAIKGDRSQLGLGIEWFGVNLWDAMIPIGVSVVSIYADYADKHAIGHGLQLTLNNSASIGWVDRGESNGEFVTLDFLKLREDKHEKLEQYKQDPWKWISG
ncbi:hypothetical protein [Alkalimarinus alittae]|uniref:Uncharacterized protein n=1 Tax=Alkalimarinus alittae TaxID=2961619 RepID=A0ABY6MZU8_9ALTE|nr:hypothetical protein [Alkalimarinus alittae]UZE95371.1 hypothetical protein NKI27_15050 [Alkalimarinus alittae]